jgi:adenosylcobinamide kinase/adenosylcobinamide-phosphate guanylyltransferase
MKKTAIILFLVLAIPALLTSCLFDEEDLFDKSASERIEAAKQEFDRFTAQDATFIFVTNEIGMGGTSGNEIQRKFTDMLGWLNQYLAAKADEVVLMVSGIPVKIK